MIMNPAAGRSLGMRAEMNEEVRRNIERFPSDFMFQLTDEESSSLRSQTATIEPGRRRHRQLATTLSELERKLSAHDQKIVVLFDAIRELMAPPVRRRSIGFRSGGTS